MLGGWALVTTLYLQLLPWAVLAAPDPKATKPAPTPSQVEQSLATLREAQAELVSSVSDMRSQMTDLQRAIAELRDEARRNRESTHDILEMAVSQVKEMREEVRGLYVESSGIKGDVGHASKRIETLDASLGSFRLSAGIIVAVVIVLQLVLVGLTFRHRG